MVYHQCWNVTNAFTQVLCFLVYCTPFHCYIKLTPTYYYILEVNIALYIPLHSLYIKALITLRIQIMNTKYNKQKTMIYYYRLSV